MELESTEYAQREFMRSACLCNAQTDLRFCTSTCHHKGGRISIIAVVQKQRKKSVMPMVTPCTDNGLSQDLPHGNS